MAVVFRELRAQNFRGFPDTGPLELGDINLFLGPNSAGKSSLLQVLLLLKQTLEDPNPENYLITDGRLAELGSFSDVVFKHDSKSGLSIDITLGETPTDVPFFYVGRRKDFVQLIPTGFHIEFAATRRVGRIYPRTFSFRGKGGINLLWGSFSSLGELKRWDTSVKLAKRSVYIRFFHFVPTAFPTEKRPVRGITSNEINFVEALSRFRQIWETTLRSLVHLQPIRTPIKPVYRATGESAVTVGPTGENLFGVLHRDERRRKTSRRELLRHLNEWLDKNFGLVRDIKLEQLTRTKALYALTGFDSKTNIQVNLAAVGFGVSQVAPIIVQGFLSPPNTCMLIEQPEIHLHPRAQAELGDLFIQFADAGKQLFVETHSQHILFRILRRIAEQKFDATRVRVFFVYRTEAGSKVEQLTLDEKGRISNWPPGFFEEGYEETAAIAQALVK